MSTMATVTGKVSPEAKEHVSKMLEARGMTVSGFINQLWNWMDTASEVWEVPAEGPEKMDAFAELQARRKKIPRTSLSTMDYAELERVMKDRDA